MKPIKAIFYGLCSLVIWSICLYVLVLLSSKYNELFMYGFMLITAGIRAAIGILQDKICLNNSVS